jgi:hypothetical protein
MKKEETIAKHKLVIDEWIANGRNGTKAYMKIYPGATEDAAAVRFHHLIGNDKIAEYIIQKEFEVSMKWDVTIESIIAELEEMRQLALQSNQISAGVSAIKEKAKLCGLYEAHNNQKSSATASQYANLLDFILGKEE